MAWTYEVLTRRFYHNDVYKFTAIYAGAPGYQNNPAYECEINKGPLPRGKYKITGRPFTHNIAGRYTLRLEPDITNRMCGRAGFLIHGDSIREPGSASSDCIVLNPLYRREIWEREIKRSLLNENSHFFYQLASDSRFNACESGEL